MKRAHWIWALVIVGAVFAVYAPAVKGPWLWDDGLEVAANAAVKQPGGWWLAWLRPTGMDYFPLKDSLLWLEWHLWGARPAGFHLTSIALHAANCLLLWKVLRELGLRGAVFGALIFAVHPVAVESVAWIAEQKTLWSLLFTLVAALAWLRWERVGSAGAYFGSLAAFAAALLTKSTVVALPVALLILRCRFHACAVAGVADPGAEGRGRNLTGDSSDGRGQRPRLQRRRKLDAMATAPFFALSTAAGVITIIFQSHRAIGVTGPMPAFGPRALQALASAALYLKTLVLPFNLAPIYGPARAGAPLVAAIAGTVAVLVAAAANRRTWGAPILAAAGWALLMLLPVLGFIPLSYLRIAPRADHLAYAAIVGVAGLAAWAIGRLRPGPAVWAAVALVAGVFAWTARAAAARYADAESFWAGAVARNPGAWLAQNNLGQLLLQRHAAAMAAEHFEAAAHTGPPSAEVHANLGAADEALGRDADARREFERAVAIDPALAGAHYDLGRSWLRAGETGAAIRELEAAIHLDPAHARAHNLLGLAYGKRGDSGRAVEQFRQALAANPDLPEAHVNLGNWLARSGDLPAAIEQYRQALRADPENRAARLNLQAAERYLGRAP